jgi:hypothetical protein
MQKILLSFFAIIYFNLVQAQNLVVNPDAESLPKGTGWTIVSAGATTCLLIPTSNYLNWTMVPDGTVNYPFDHTTGAAGGTIFFSGCSGSFLGPFELQQDVDVSADATNIDLGNSQYTFSGYMQTPVSNQTDEGRFIVDYLNASNAILGTSYTSAWQSFFFGSGAGWVFYTDTRLAPVGTRKIRIRLQSQMFFNVPAINVYFDDISLIKVSVVPVKIISFTGKHDVSGNNLKWTIADELNLTGYEIERSNDGHLFTEIGDVASGHKAYSFVDKNISNGSDKYFYRLKMVNIDGKFSFSKAIPIFMKDQQKILLSPNPAKNFVTVSGLKTQGIINVINAGGASVLSVAVRSQTTTINVSTLPAGIYFMRYANGENVSFEKLIIQNR